MIYEYICEETKEVIEKEFPMSGEIPKELEENGKIFHRAFLNTSIHIPFQWGQESPIKYNKSPSGKKHFY